MDITNQESINAHNQENQDHELKGKLEKSSLMLAKFLNSAP